VAYNIRQLYKPYGLYWYRSGINVRAVVSFLVGVIPQLPSLAYRINPEARGLSRSYTDFASLGWLEGLVFSA